MNIVVPQLGESVIEARVARWLKKAGDAVAQGDPLVELETEKIDLEVSAGGRVVEEAEAPLTRRPAGWIPGSDVVHERYGAGWVWGSGLGRVTVRFETAESGPGPVHTFGTDDAQLRPAVPAD